MNPRVVDRGAQRKPVDWTKQAWGSAVVLEQWGKGFWREMGPHGGCVVGMGVNGEEAAIFCWLGESMNIEREEERTRSVGRKKECRKRRKEVGGVNEEREERKRSFLVRLPTNSNKEKKKKTGNGSVCFQTYSCLGSDIIIIQGRKRDRGEEQEEKIY